MKPALVKDTVVREDSDAVSVSILLCTFQGERFLAEQLESLARQTYANWRVYASDDGSSDGTVAILTAYQQAWGGGRLLPRSGPGRGFVANFLALACDRSIESDYFAFCDQDDIWDDDKLQRAIAWLAGVPTTQPALYCGRTKLIDEMGGAIGMSPLFVKSPTFRNALVQSIAGGNTMVFNRAARDLLMLGGEDADVITHDWWLYMLVTGCGGTAKYDVIPSIRYRQHGANLVGSNLGIGASYLRAMRLLNGNFLEMNSRNICALSRTRTRLTLKSVAVLDEFSRARVASFFYRISGLWKSGVHHQTKLGNLGMVIAALLGKL